jgi:hypothetical protein
MFAALTNPTFWDKVDVRSHEECWLWLRAQDNAKDPYGRAYSRVYAELHPTGRRKDTAHQIAYSLINGYPPSGLHVLHSCDRPLCCNPNHLRLGTPADNAADRQFRGRSKGWQKGKTRPNYKDVNYVKA